MGTLDRDTLRLGRQACCGDPGQGQPLLDKHTSNDLEEELEQPIPHGTKMLSTQPWTLRGQ